MDVDDCEGEDLCRLCDTGWGARKADSGDTERGGLRTTVDSLLCDLLACDEDECDESRGGEGCFSSDGCTDIFWDGGSAGS